jgi:hypothetical protein
MAATTIDLFLNPRAFFEAKVSGNAGLKVPALIVLVIGIISAVSAYLISGLTVQLLPPEVAAFGSLITIFGAVGALIGAFVIWIVVTAIFYGISAIFGGEGSFRRTLVFVGYGYAPQILGGIISTVFTALFASSVQVPAVTDPNEIANITTQLMQDPLVQIATLIGILFMLWSANIWIFGVKYARNLSLKNAAITVGVPVALYVLYVLFNLF